jgi:site-specific DNA recombinase
MKTALYIRVSTEEQAREGYSLAAQERTLTEHCEKLGHEIAGIYKDEGISAKDIQHRPALMQLLADAKQRKFELVLVWKLSRLTRSLRDLCGTIDDFGKYGVALVSYSEAFDVATPTGRMVTHVLGSVAQLEREMTSENVKLAALERAVQGKRTCSSVLGYDADGTDSLAVNEKEAEIIRFIFAEYLRCRNFKKVSRLCQDRGYHGKMGGQIHAGGVRKILTCPIYCGYNSLHGALYKGAHKAIIDSDVYNTVREIIEAQATVRFKHALVSI